MEQNRNDFQWWWHYDQPIPNGATVVMPLGCTGGTFSPAGLNVALVRGCRYLSWSIIGSAALTLRVNIGNATVSLATWITYAYPGGTVWNTVFDLPAPYQNNTGRLVLTIPYCQITVQNASGGVAGSFQFNARAWRG